MENFNILFDLDDSQALPILEGVVGSPIERFTTDVPAGAQGDKRLVTFRCNTPGGAVEEVVLFVKRCVWKRKSEAVHYRYLASQDVPVARLHGALVNRLGEEVIFLERLCTFGIHKDSDDEFRAMLSLLARFNACPVTAEYEAHMHPYEQIGCIGGGMWISGLDASPDKLDIEAGLRASGVSAAELPALTQVACAIFQRVSKHPKGLLHQDFSPDNFGWHDGRREMVVFDLHKNALGPRFADVAPYLASPDWAGFMKRPGRTGEVAEARRVMLAQHYLEEYARFGGLRVSLSQFLIETAELVWAHRVASLPFLLHEARQERVREILDFLRKQSTIVR